MRKLALGMVILLCAALAPWPALAAGEGLDTGITKSCVIKPSSNASSFRRAVDGNTASVWKSAAGSGQEIDIVTKAAAGAVYIRWDKEPPAWTLYSVDSNGNRKAVTRGGGEYLTDCAVIPQAYSSNRHFVLVSGGDQPFCIAELTVFAAGKTPDYVPQWSPTAGNMDIMVVATHPDDDQLYLGAVAPAYAQLGKRSITLFMTTGNPVRRFEALEGVWASGGKVYPVFGSYKDGGLTYSLAEASKVWPKQKAEAFIVRQIRKYKPAILVTQDINGEYGHGAHKYVSQLVRQAYEDSGNPQFDPDSAQLFGVWNVAKLYIHLYQQNKITLDVSAPLSVFGGRTAFDMAKAGYGRHLSQHKYTNFQVRESGKYNIREFGLYASRVGFNDQNNNMFSQVTLQKLKEINPTSQTSHTSRNPRLPFAIR